MRKVPVVLATCVLTFGLTATAQDRGHEGGGEHGGGGGQQHAEVEAVTFLPTGPSEVAEVNQWSMVAPSPRITPSRWNALPQSTDGTR